LNELDQIVQGGTLNRWNVFVTTYTVSIHILVYHSYFWWLYDCCKIWKTKWVYQNC